MREDNGIGFMTGFFTGAAVGAMAALLLAPKSGRELREELAEGSGRLRERAYGTARELRERGEHAVDATRRTVREAASEVKDVSRRLRRGEAREVKPNDG
ncbi:MAG: YtxH domain-containing protein [Vicinamibacteria bacterium]